MCTGNENSKPIRNKFIIRKDIIETSQVVLIFCRTVYIYASANEFTFLTIKSKIINDNGWSKL